MTERHAITINLTALRARLQIGRITEEDIDLLFELLHSARAEADELRRVVDVALNEKDAEHDANRALLIAMRHYFVAHGLMTGECVAWMHLKYKFAVGQTRAADDEGWLAEYRLQHPTVKAALDGL